MFNGDVSFERLTSKGYDTAPTEFNYLQTACTIILLILTRLKIPVSTTFMILTSFVTKPKALGKTIMKSVSGYGISFALAVVIYLPFCKFVTDYCDRTRGNLSACWTYVQWFTTGILWSTWVQQDMSNIAVFLQRSLNEVELAFICLFFTAEASCCGKASRRGSESRISQRPLSSIFSSLSYFSFSKSLPKSLQAPLGALLGCLPE